MGTWNIERIKAKVNEILVAAQDPRKSVTLNGRTAVVALNLHKTNSPPKIGFYTAAPSSQVEKGADRNFARIVDYEKAGAILMGHLTNLSTSVSIRDGRTRGLTLILSESFYSEDDDTDEADESDYLRRAHLEVIHGMLDDDKDKEE